MGSGNSKSSSGAAAAYRKYLDLEFLDSLYRINVEPDQSPDGDTLDRSIASFYDRLASGASARHLWNWGCNETEFRERVAGHLDGETDGFSEQLYARTFIDDMRRAPPGSVIVDIGCGAGQGTMLLARMNPGLKFVGLDLSRDAILAARQANRRDNLAFVHASFTQLQQAVGDPRHAVSVESMHNYPSLSEFLAATSDALAPGSLLSIVDFFTAQRRAEWDRVAARNAQWRLERDEDISVAVRSAIATRVASIRREAKLGQKNPLKRYVTSRGREIMVGAQFLDRGNSLVGHLIRLLSRGRVMKIDSYRHLVLRRV